VVCSPLPGADSQIFALSTSAGHQHSSPAPLLYVLAWVSLLEIGLAGWVPRVLGGACRLADYPPELELKKLVNGFRSAIALQQGVGDRLDFPFFPLRNSGVSINTSG